MKNKIIGWLAYALDILWTVFGMTIAVAFVLAYHFGIPYLFYKFLNSGKDPYSFYLAVWFGTSYVLELWNRYKLKKQLKEYKEIDDILKGRF
ncbi:hypothetical protein LAV92_28250 [Bacillus cereus]|uniref:hypothetical protein n=1 Tax=Bacillus cereus TaxID=1396 RepID=UPI0023E3F734|nr:hypothetical protein [Bacillus cereus]MDF3555557.1 hypothetical protein [Bacillus cereus]